MTAVITDGPGYALKPDASAASVTVRDNDAAELTLSVDADAVGEAGEGAAATTIAITNGVVFQDVQVIDIALGGTATPGSDFTFTGIAGRTFTKPYTFRLPAGTSSVSGVFTALNDSLDDDDETIVISAMHGGAPVGTPRAVTIIDDDDPPPPLALQGLSVTSSTADRRPMHPTFDPGVLHYSVGCSETTFFAGPRPGESNTFTTFDTMTVRFSATDPDTRVAVNGTQASPDTPVRLSRLDGESDIELTLSNTAGTSRTYTVHCLDDDFPTVRMVRSDGAWDGAMTVSASLRDAQNNRWTYLAIIDRNGVPLFRRRVGIASHFKVHPRGRYPYSYGRWTGPLPTLNGQSISNNEIAVLNEGLREVDTARVVSPLTHTDNHDFVIMDVGDYVLMAYEPVRRDLSAFRCGDDFCSNAEGTEDSVIQEVRAAGTEAFRWNSWDHMALEDCTQHRFPWDYAHVNSVEVVGNGDLVASFRDCSQVLRIDRTTGDVVWRLGRSNRSADEWVASGGKPPLALVGDPTASSAGSTRRG